MTATTPTAYTSLLTSLEVVVTTLQVLIVTLQSKLRTISGVLYRLLLIRGTEDRFTSYLFVISLVGIRESVRSVSNRCQQMIKEIIVSLDEFQAGVAVVLLGSITSVVSSSIGMLLVVGGTGWLLKDIPDYVSTTTSTETITDADHETGVDQEDAPAVDDTSTSDDEVWTLGPEDRILETIQKHDGQVQQKHIVAEMDLSEPSVSRYLSSLESKGEIEKVCVGRENIVYLSEHTPDAVQTPETEQFPAT